MRKLLTGAAQVGEDITSAKAVALNGTTEYALLDTDLGIGAVGSGMIVRLGLLLSGLDTSRPNRIRVQARISDAGDTIQYKDTVRYIQADTTDSVLYAVLDIPVIWISSGVKYLRVSIQSYNVEDTAVTHQGILYSEEAQSGTGDTAVTLTVRTTSGTPLDGVQVWLNSADARTDSVVEPQYTNASGEVTFYLDEDATYYVFCQKSGYSFATTGHSVTPTSTTTTFTLDLGTAVTVAEGTSDGYADSFLYRMLQETRLNLDEPGLNAKYTDAQLITKIEQAYAAVVGEVNRNNQTPVVGRYTITYTSGTNIYALPPHIAYIHAIYEEGDQGTKIFYGGRSMLNPAGRGIWIEGSWLHIQTDFMENNTDLVVEFVPNGTSRLHTGYLTNATHVNADKDEVTIGASVGYGTVDYRENAYVGCVLRILGTGAEERVITAYNRTTGVVTLASALSGTYTSGNSYYEIAPAINKGLDHVVGLYASRWIASVEGHTTRSAQIQKMYMDAMRNLRLQAFYGTKIDEVLKTRVDNHNFRRYTRRH
jgi:hypothetical protein